MGGAAGFQREFMRDRNDRDLTALLKYGQIQPSTEAGS
jgi:hypothetical protein